MWPSSLWSLIWLFLASRDLGRCVKGHISCITSFLCIAALGPTFPGRRAGREPVHVLSNRIQSNPVIRTEYSTLGCGSLSGVTLGIAALLPLDKGTCHMELDVVARPMGQTQPGSAGPPVRGRRGGAQAARMLTGGQAPSLLQWSHVAPPVGREAPKCSLLLLRIRGHGRLCQGAGVRAALPVAASVPPIRVVLTPWDLIVVRLEFSFFLSHCRVSVTGAVMKSRADYPLS